VRFFLLTATQLFVSLQIVRQLLVHIALGQMNSSAVSTRSYLFRIPTG
jgi:hypothetical protein